MSSKNSVTILYDPISPWSYIALALLKRNETAWKLDLKLQPAALGYIFQAAGNRAPLVVRNKGKMMAQEFRLFTDLYNIPVSDKAWTFSMEAQQKPPNSLPLTRFLMVVQQEESASVLEDVSLKVFHAVFAEGDTDLFAATANNDVDRLHSLVSSSLSKDKVKKYLDKSNTKEFKEYTKNEAKKYVEEWNAYGVPYMQIKRARDGKVMHFMGSDRFEVIAAWLGVPYKVSSQSKL
ncbi:thioredoxin-like protein [Cystobasidium minutum MCA 4210]|uniref:thioredoxin-like protein n=1 Tax=Cystobasidium minutum MCA 4210 TaxID=1397322 RepID=UPI0034CD4C71|eukprot:jgi/Rhomi1/209340/estExt_Genemark1.C_2_t30189